ncbi:MAG: hypothetical protein WCF26_21265 [Candidatus Sulfotelmatobacter sp.]
MEQVLKHVKSPIRVLVVWEPMLPTDWSRPGGMVQSRISDPRAVQFWDKNHLVAKELKQQLSSSQICCERNGIIWDVAAVYPKDLQWGSSAPLFFGGAVVDVADSVRQKLLEFEHPQSLNNDVPIMYAARDAARHLSELSRGSR